MNLLAIDPSLRNTGVVAARYVFDSTVEPFDLHLITTEPDRSKQVRRNSDDLRCAFEMRQQLEDLISLYDPLVVFVEVPSGTQSARAGWTLGITVGVLSGLLGRSFQIIEVSAQPVKKFFTGKRNASKREMIETAHRAYPDLPWRRHGGRLTNDNEHLADAVAILGYGATLPVTRSYLDLVRLRGAS